MGYRVTSPAAVVVEGYVTVTPKRIHKTGDWAFAACAGRGSDTLLLSVYAPPEFDMPDLAKNERVTISGVLGSLEFVAVRKKCRGAVIVKASGVSRSDTG